MNGFPVPIFPLALCFLQHLSFNLETQWINETSVGNIDNKSKVVRKHK